MHRWKQERDFTRRGRQKFIEKRLHKEATGRTTTIEGGTGNRFFQPKVHAITVTRVEKEERHMRNLGK
jgi:hypothetical protein